MVDRYDPTTVAFIEGAETISETTKSKLGFVSIVDKKERKTVPCIFTYDLNGILLSHSPAKILVDKVAFKDDNHAHLPKSGHTVRQATISQITYVDAFNTRVSQTLDKPIDVIYKHHKGGKAFASKVEVALSAIWKKYLDCDTSEVYGHYPGNQIEGVVIKKVDFKDFTKLGSVKKADGTPVTYADLDPKSLAKVLTSCYYLEEDDLHKQNIGIVPVSIVIDKDGNVKYKVFKIDHDMSMYNRVVKRMREGARAWYIAHDDRFVVTPEDIRNFPNLEYARIHYWPTRNSYGKPGDPKRYSDADMEFFKGLSNNAEFNKWKFGFFLKDLLVDLDLVRTAINQSLKEDDPGYIDMLVDALSIRRDNFRAALYSMPEFRQALENNIEEYARELAPELEISEAQLKTTIQEIIADCKKFDATDTPLHIAIKIKDGFRGEETTDNFYREINLQNSVGETPLHIAAKMGHLRTVQCLISAGAKRYFQDNQNQYALELAIENGHYLVVQYLLKLGHGLGVDKIKSLIESAKTNHHYDIALSLKQHYHQVNCLNGITTQDAMDHQQPYMLQYLLTQGVVNIPTPKPATNANSLVCAWLLKDHCQGFVALQNHVPTPDTSGMSNDTVFNALTTYVKAKGATLYTSRSAFECITRANVTDLMAKALCDSKNSALFPILAVHNKRLNGKEAEDNLVEAMENALKMIREDQTLSLAERKEAALRCYTLVVPHISTAANLTKLADMATDNRNLYLKQLTCRLWLIRVLRGDTHGVTSTYKSIFNLLFNRATQLEDKAEKKLACSTAHASIATLYSDNISGFFAKITRGRTAHPCYNEFVSKTVDEIEKRPVAVTC